MMTRKLTTLIFFILLPLTSWSKVTVITYNMAQLRRTFDLVACTKRRIIPQVQAMLYDEDSAAGQGEPFIYFLQEVFNKNAFKKIQAAALELGFYYYPQNYDDVKNNGQMMISNLKALESSFTPYTRDKYVAKGLLYTLFELPSGDKIGAVDVHTTYSDGSGFTEEHKQQFHDMADFVKTHENRSRYFVLGGDFNAGPNMQYRNQKFDAARIIWHEGALPIVSGVGMKHIDTAERTWDKTSNPLVKKPAFIVKLYNFFSSGRGSWDETDATLDHIFVSNEIEVLESGLTFKEKVRTFCPGRSDWEGKSTLSDHYGFRAVLDID